MAALAKHINLHSPPVMESNTCSRGTLGAGKELRRYESKETFAPSGDYFL